MLSVIINIMMTLIINIMMTLNIDMINVRMNMINIVCHY